ncbi:Hpt domain-containing protein [Patescibacteria group bacterium]|nr:Hpt domain-containing protein [Patescibacteria group bacterium]
MQIEFIDAYFESTEEELAKLEAALAANDIQTVYIKSHSIKGAARYVGALKVSSIFPCCKR